MCLLLVVELTSYPVVSKEGFMIMVSREKTMYVSSSSYSYYLSYASITVLKDNNYHENYFSSSSLVVNNIIVIVIMMALATLITSQHHHYHTVIKTSSLASSLATKNLSSLLFTIFIVIKNHQYYPHPHLSLSSSITAGQQTVQPKLEFVWSYLCLAGHHDVEPETKYGQAKTNLNHDQ